MEKHVVDADEFCSGCGWSSTTSRRRLPCEALLAHLEESARQGCLRCDLLVKAIKLYKNQWPSTESIVVVRCILQSGTGTGTRVWWPKEHGRPWAPFGKREAWEQTGLEIFSPQRPDLPWSQLSSRSAPASATSGSLGFLRAMMDDCAAHHTVCNESEPDIRSPTRLLRIVDDNISGRRVFLVTTNPGRSYPYTALSHCWGSPDEAKKIPKTTRANLLRQHGEGLPVTDLTRTFQDAIKLTLDLGFEYTWIDSLCIIQGDAADWAVESVTMASVYGGANLVIAATCGANGNNGLYPQRDACRYISIPVAGDPVTIPVRSFKPGDWDHQTWRFGFWNTSSDLDLPLHTRAWTFQERLLAKRIVHFTRMELIWECWTSSSCECGELRDEVTRQAFPFAKSKHREAIFNNGVDGRLRAWDDVMAGYSVRNITYYQDRVQAIASIALQFDSGSNSGLGRYLCGIWEADLPMGLLWYSLLIQSKEKHYKPHRRLRDWTVPTWSWLSVQGDIFHQDREVISTPVAIVQSILYRTCSKNPYGAPLEAPCLGLRGRTIEIKVENQGGNVDPYYMVVHSSSDERHPMDTDVQVPETPFANEAKIKALQITTSDENGAVVVRQVGKGNQYERLGLASVDSDVFEKYGKEEDILLV
ncbi:heterokaryon incompatibility protein-domain-containing protein [Schizothecium vesticola]|uniref:Heterokaryon incompatibility protein-domain-containing protein n=1 Tax=Schizothecium vesticola TaxID=314040 RepID=A0AA40F4P4_9PEZI|nr:heterokaryon incompatibility protein-domain-containing protein [Schizothecium vesticola]